MVARTLNIKKRSVAILFLAAILVPAIVTVAGLFDLADLSSEAVDIASLLTGAFIISEIGVVGMFNRKKIRKDPLRFFGIIVGLAILISAGLSLLGLDAIVFDRIQGVMGILGILYSVSEAVKE